MSSFTVEQAADAIKSVVGDITCTHTYSRDMDIMTVHDFNVTPGKGHVNLTADTFFRKAKKLGLLASGVRGATSPQKIVTYVNTDTMTELTIKGTNTPQILSVRVTYRKHVSFGA